MELVRLYKKVNKTTSQKNDEKCGTYKRYNGGDWFAEIIQEENNDEYILRVYTTLKTGVFKDGTHYEVLQKMPTDWLGGFHESLLTQEPKSLNWSSQNLENLETLGEFEVHFFQAQTLQSSCLDGEYKTQIELLLEEVSESKSSLQPQPHELQVQKPSQLHHRPALRRHQQPLEHNQLHPSQLQPHELQDQKPSQLHHRSALRRQVQPSEHNQQHSQLNQQQSSFPQKQRQESQRPNTRQPSHSHSSQIPVMPQAPREQDQLLSQERSVPSRKCPSHISGRLMEPMLLHS